MSEPDGMLALGIAVQKGKWPHTMDAQTWTKEWMKCVTKDPSIATCKATMLTWFANAIMAGYDRGALDASRKEASDE